ncbi:MAG: hypothetical protein PHQ27_10705 [Victivallales bacterium]|nr:hypothetical protein [Victivallales bacterium]
MLKVYFRTFLLGFFFLIGFLTPSVGKCSGLIPYLIGVMLLIAFMRCSAAPWRTLTRTHLKVLLANIAIGLTGWGLFRLLGYHDLAEVAFYVGITPTAAAAPVIMGLLDGKVEFVTGALLINNLAMAVLFPFLLMLVDGQFVPEIFTHAVLSVGRIMVVPAILAMVLLHFFPRSRQVAVKCAGMTFFIWVAVLFLAAAKCAAELQAHPQPAGLMLRYGALSLLICVVNFTLGRWLGRPDYSREASQSLGQKNTTLTIYLALTYAGGAVALGPMFYVFWHNLWNALQLHRHQVRLLRRQ